MRCHDAATALMEGHERSRELRAHLEGCGDCRALAALHASASDLHLPSPPALAPISRDAMLREVRRRVIRRRAGAGAVASMCLGAVLLWPRPPSPLPEGEAPSDYHYMEGESAPRAELGLTREPREDTFSESEEDSAPALLAARGSLLNLMGEVRGYTRRDLVVQDAAYRPYGTLAAWLRPPDSRALETPPYRTAVLPVLYSQE